MALEYRVRWQREGRNPTYRIYQHGDTACRKVRGLLALEIIKAKTERYADMGDLVGPPELQVREVGEWHANEYQPTASEFDVNNMGEWAWWTGGAHEKPSRESTPDPFPF